MGDLLLVAFPDSFGRGFNALYKALLTSGAPAGRCGLWSYLRRRRSIRGALRLLVTLSVLNGLARQGRRCACGLATNCWARRAVHSRAAATAVALCGMFSLLLCCSTPVLPLPANASAAGRRCVAGTPTFFLLTYTYYTPTLRTLTRAAKTRTLPHGAHARSSWGRDICGTDSSYGRCCACGNAVRCCFAIACCCSAVLCCFFRLRDAPASSAGSLPTLSCLSPRGTGETA